MQRCLLKFLGHWLETTAARSSWKVCWGLQVGGVELELEKGS